MTNRISHKSSLADSGAFVIGLFLLLVPLLCLLGADVCFALGGRMNPYIFPVALIGSGAVARVLAFRGKNTDMVLLWCFLIALASVAGAAILNDPSSDGIIYHQEIIVHLLDGWNPFHTPEAGSPDPDIELLVAHYAKGAEIMAATVASFTGYIESGKAINIFTVVGTGFLAYPILTSRLGVSRGRIGVLTALLVALNPVGMSQVLSYYNDFYTYYLIIITLAVFLASPGRFSRLQILALGGVIIVAASVKFTAFFYVGLTVFGVMLYYFFTRRSRLALRIGFVSLLWVLLAVLGTSYHPYVTNTIIAGHPCYPLMGEGAIDIMTGNTPGIYVGHNRFVNFFISILTPIRPAVAPTFGGFGPLCAPMLLYSLVAVCVAVARRRVSGVWLYASLLALGACFIFEQSWWARYIPFLWILPVVGAIVSRAMSRVWRLCGMVLMWAGILTGVLYLGSSIFLSAQIAAARHAALAIVGTGPARIDSGLLYNENGEIISRGVLSTEHHIREEFVETVSIDPSDAEAKNMVAICLTGYYQNPSGVYLYLDPAMENRVRHEFTETLTAKFLRLHNFVSEGLKVES